MRRACRFGPGLSGRRRCRRGPVKSGRLSMSRVVAAWQPMLQPPLQSSAARWNFGAGSATMTPDTGSKQGSRRSASMCATLSRSTEGRTSNAVVIVDAANGERLVIGARDVNMPNGTSWLPLERLDGATLVLADLRWVEAARVVFARARELGLPTVLDADIGGRESLTEILSLTDYAIFSKVHSMNSCRAWTSRRQLDRIMLMGPRHAGVTRWANGLCLARYVRWRGMCGIRRAGGGHDGRWRRFPWRVCADAQRAARHC